MTFKRCADAYIDMHGTGWRNAKHAKQWPSTLNAYVYPVFGDLPVQSVDTALVMNRYGRRSLRRPTEFAVGSRRFSIGPKRLVIGRARTRRDGEGTSKIC